jgi:GntR family transcriptional regulator/MocR family aminotransferase
MIEVSRGADFLQLSPASAPARGLTSWLAGAIRAAIMDGRLPAGTSLPATRLLAGDLGISRGVVVEAYQRLADEGLVSGRPGTGTRVSGLPPRPVRRKKDVARPGTGATVLPQPWRARAELDLSPGVPDLSGFPRGAWLRAERSVLDRASVAELGYGDPRGSEWLRRELAVWLARTRGLRAAADDIIIVSGVAQALALLAQALNARGIIRIAVEDPGSRGSRDQLTYWGLATVPVPVDEHGLAVGDLAGRDLRAALLTPAHQFPTGVVLAPERRRELLDWAVAADAVIIEDDYDAEYRYDRAPVPALQAAAPGHVAYASTTSKTLAPGLRLGWLIPPARLHADLVEAKHAADLGSPALPQLVLARLIATGELEHHIRLVRKRQRARRDALLGALRVLLPEARVQGVPAGLHLLITFPALALDDAELAERVHQAGVLVHPLSWHRQRPGPPGLVLGYAAHTPDQLREAARRIARAWRGLALGVGAAMLAGGGVHLGHARRPGQDGQQHAADRRQQQGYAERKVPVRAEVGDVHPSAVLQNEDQQEQQHQGEEGDGEPQAADPGVPDLVIRRRARSLRPGLLPRWRRVEPRVVDGGGSWCLGGLRFGAHEDTPLRLGQSCPSARRLCAGSALQVGQHGEHAPVVVVGRLQVELSEDGGGVPGHGAFGDDEALGDSGVRPAFGHKGEHLTLARAECADTGVAGVTGEQTGDDLRVHGGATGRDPADGIDKLGAVEHPVLEQIADAAAAAGQQLTGVQLLDVLGQDQYRQPGCLRPAASAARIP